MGVYLDPNRMASARRRVVLEWLKANGQRRHVALAPVIIKGRWVEFDELPVRFGPTERADACRFPLGPDGSIPTRRRRLRIRVPFPAGRAFGGDR